MSLARAELSTACTSRCPPLNRSMAWKRLGTTDFNKNYDTKIKPKLKLFCSTPFFLQIVNKSGRKKTPSSDTKLLSWHQSWLTPALVLWTILILSSKLGLLMIHQDPNGAFKCQGWHLLTSAASQFTCVDDGWDLITGWCSVSFCC